MSEARRQRRAFKRAYDKATKQYKMPITTTSVFDGIPVGEKFIEEYNKILTKSVEDYEVTTSSK